MFATEQAAITQGTFEDDRTKRIGKYHVSGKTVKTKLFRTDEKDRYIHVYYNELRAAVERENMEGKIDRLERKLTYLQVQRSIL